MSTNEIGEKIYYSDAASKVTNVRVTCNHITVPVEKIDSVDVNFRIEAFSFSVLIFFASFIPLFFTGPIPEAYDAAYLFFVSILIAASLLWMIFVFNEYAELVVSVSGRNLVIHRANMVKKDLICKIAASIGDAISDDKEFRVKRKSGEIKTGEFNASETVRLKLMLEDYEKLKVMKDDLLKKNG